ncbi:TIGR01212 family radical SAM protein, partial [Fibrobacterota bacterium]
MPDFTTILWVMYSYSQHLKKRFGQPVLKIPVNGGFSCPNRDGTRGRNGCIFCDNRAFSPVAETREPVTAQLEKGIAKAPARYKKFIAYFQPYSNTYGKVHKLMEVYESAISFPRVVGLAVGTRPDCISPEVLEYLAEVSQRTYLSIELGIQTVHDSTLRNINRYQAHAEAEAVIWELDKRGIEIVAHVILGLPGESRDMMLETADVLSQLPVHGVKLHQLMILRGTDLETKYHRGSVSVLSLEEYADLVGDFVLRLGPGKCLHRLMADCFPGSGLVAPMWSSGKGK